MYQLSAGLHVLHGETIENMIHSQYKQFSTL